MSDLPHFRLFIDGAWTDGARGQVMRTQNPATGADWTTFACAAPEDVERAVAAARRALDDPAWRDMKEGCQTPLSQATPDSDFIQPG